MASNMTPIDEIMKAFRIELNISPYGDGHINDTFVADSTPRYILQRVNTSIFKNPDELMENIVSVTEHLRKKIIAAGGNAQMMFICQTHQPHTLIIIISAIMAFHATQSIFFRLTNNRIQLRNW